MIGEELGPGSVYSSILLYSSTFSLIALSSISLFFLPLVSALGMHSSRSFLPVVAVTPHISRLHGLVLLSFSPPTTHHRHLIVHHLPFRCSWQATALLYTWTNPSKERLRNLGTVPHTYLATTIPHNSSLGYSIWGSCRGTQVHRRPSFLEIYNNHACSHLSSRRLPAPGFYPEATCPIWLTQLRNTQSNTLRLHQS